MVFGTAVSGNNHATLGKKIKPWKTKKGLLPPRPPRTTKVNFDREKWSL
jgi:hypothetical protein